LVSVALALLSACTAEFTQQPGGGYSPTLVQANVPGAGPVPLNAPAQGPSGNLPPPSNLVPPPAGSPLPVPGAAADHSGNYSGVADVLSSGGGQCWYNHEVTNFRVNGNRVRFGGFRGTIDANGGVQMVRGNTWITGQFSGSQFTGTLTYTPMFNDTFGCSYRLVLDRTS
jgi:hypothetical protein